MSRKFNLSPLQWMGVVFFVIIFVIAAVLIGGLIAYLLWNAIIYSMFGGPHITYWQAVLINVAVGWLLNRIRGSNGKSN